MEKIKFKSYVSPIVIGKRWLTIVDGKIIHAHDENLNLKIKQACNVKAGRKFYDDGGPCSLWAYVGAFDITRSHIGEYKTRYLAEIAFLALQGRFGYRDPKFYDMSAHGPENGPDVDFFRLKRHDGGQIIWNPSQYPVKYDRLPNEMIIAKGQKGERYYADTKPVDKGVHFKDINTSFPKWSQELEKLVEKSRDMKVINDGDSKGFVLSDEFVIREAGVNEYRENYSEKEFKRKLEELTEFLKSKGCTVEVLPVKRFETLTQKVKRLLKGLIK